MSERKKQSLLNGAIILVISTLVVKVIGLCFKMPLGNMLGMVGVGYFNSVYVIYTPIYAISMAGLPVAVSRMVAESVALNRYREARMTLVTARKIFLLMGFPMIPKPINPTFIFSSKRSIKIKKEYNSYFYKKVIPENKKEQIDINDFLFRKN